MDRFEIVELLTAYNFAIDIGDEQACAAIYTNDARYEGPTGTAVGARSIARVIRRDIRSRFGNGGRYLMGPVVVDVDGDFANARSYWWIVSGGERPSVHTLVFYDELRHTGERWQVTCRRQELHPTWLGVTTVRRRRRRRIVSGQLG
ncbi:nuclear transport factor 2 family protein [Micromonospora sp. NPDC047707]|uniref:nuclear transport factor 2 family protein n=1 Tax=Micromonospora sp. NPDC047707 TaxID=3154498 RepID=UPI0034566731